MHDQAIAWNVTSAADTERSAVGGASGDGAVSRNRGSTDSAPTACHAGNHACNLSAQSDEPSGLARARAISGDRNSWLTVLCEWRVREKSALGMASASQWEKIAHAGVSQWRWRAVAIAPTVVASGLIEWLALGAIFVTITLYPFGLIGEREPERDLYRAVILNILLTGSAVASVGLLQRAWWNGKLLWFWAPQDWGGPLLAQAPRASGPFVDPDHFANYLAMVLPLTIITSLFHLKIVQPEKRANLRLAAVIGSLIMGFALLFSLSRAGWASAIVGIGVALMCASRVAREMAASRTIAKFRISPALLIPIAIAASVAIMLFFAGSRGREAIDARLNPAHNSMYYRPTVWRDTLKLIGDFPLFGVGLGCWPEFFPHYRRPPWSPFFFREAENDYLQLIAEIGLLGASAGELAGDQAGAGIQP